MLLYGETTTIYKFTYSLLILQLAQKIFRQLYQRALSIAPRVCRNTVSAPNRLRCSALDQAGHVSSPGDLLGG